MPCRCTDVLPMKEGGIQVLASLAPSSQTVGFLLRPPPLAGLPKMANFMLGNFTSKGKYTQLLLIKHIR